METKLEKQINEVLKSFPDYWDGDELLKNKVIEDLRDYKEELISKLLEKDLIRQTYSFKAGSATIFKLIEFISMLRYKKYWENSYTRYRTKIGLTSEGKYLRYNTDVVLDFPYKDAVLEGGMTCEDIVKNEVYYHNVLAKEEIDVLLSPKVFSNVKKYDISGESKISEFKDTDNLIIKGNNLIALHSLKERYAGKIKLIYIDPPYNTGNDSFIYNDRFSHSTWLTFMKNRLEIAKQLLSQDGSIWINIDDNEAHYLKVLCDEIFGRNNFISNVIWQKKFSPQNDAKYFSDMHDHILVYAKDKELFKINLLPRTSEMNKRYKNPDNDPRGPWTSSDLTVKTYSKEYDYPIKTPSGKIIYPPKSRCWRTSKENFEKLVKENRVWFGEDGDNVPRLKRFLKDVKQGITPVSIWLHTEVSHNQEARKEITSLLDEADFATPKPEKLIQRIVHLGTNRNDIVLDFFMGSATTQAVAMKMNRRFIGVEQMDYINTVSIPRLQKVIEGEQGGISQDVNWKGGGSFVYAELHDLNSKYVQMIRQAKDEQELKKIYDKLQKNAYLNFKVDFKKIMNSKDDVDYLSLSLKQKKEILIDTLDMNQLYLSYSEIEDPKYKIDEDTINFNHSFYEKELNKDE